MRPALLLLALLLLPRPAAAQQSYGLERAPTRPVYQPGSGVADGASAFAVTTNPASLGDLQALELGLRDTETGSGSLFSGRGTALYAAAPLPYLGFLQLHGALDVLRPPGVPGVSARLTLGLSARLSSAVALGLSYGHLFAGPGDLSVNGTNTVDLGVRLRAGRFLAAGLVVRDLAANTAGPGDLQRVYDLELLGRPAGDERVELAAGARIGEALGDVEPRLRLWVRPIPGLSLLLEGAALLPPGPTPSGAAGDVAWRVGLGLQLDFAHVGAQVVEMASGATRPGPFHFEGGSVALRFSWQRQPALYETGQRLVRIEPGSLTGVPFLRLLQDLRQLERDRRCAGVVVILGGLRVGWGRADELREALLRLRAARKRVYVYGADLNTMGYYVATAAERVYLDPTGSLHIIGLSSGSFHLREALDLIGVKADLLRVGEYKSFPESFTASAPSAAARAEHDELLDDLFVRLLGGVAAARRLTEAQVRALIDRGLYTPAEALKAGLVDQVAFGDAVEESILREVPGGQIVPLREQLPRYRSWAPRQVAVINIEGNLFEGRSQVVPLVNFRIAGGNTLVQAVEQAARDAQVAAIVLRIETPGGSVGVSEVLARLVAQVAQRKPVVCSFGDVAASGGYYLAAPCTAIYTGAMTSAGSIGIFGGKVAAGPLLDRLGVRVFTAVRGEHADMDSNLRPYTDAERALVQGQLQAGYDRFIEVVAQGRRLPKARVDQLGRGRIYSGARAVTLKLADRLGGLMDAVADARGRAGLAPDGGELVFYPQQQRGLLGQALGLMGLPLPDAQEEPAAESLLGTLGRALFHVPAVLLLQQGRLVARMEDEPPG